MTVKPEATRGKVRQSDGSVRVWGEVGVTVAIGDGYEFVKVLHGHERIAPNSRPATLKRYERLIDEHNEVVVERQVRKYKRIAKAVVSVQK